MRISISHQNDSVMQNNVDNRNQLRNEHFCKVCKDSVRYRIYSIPEATLISFIAFFLNSGVSRPNFSCAPHMREGPQGMRYLGNICNKLF